MGYAQLKIQKEQDSLAETVWGVDWSQYFPAVMPKDENIDVRMVEFDTANEYIGAKFPEMYAQICNERFNVLDAAKHKQKFLAATADFFLFFDKGQPFGVGVGHPFDWAGYNFRNISLERDYRGRGIYQWFFPYLMSVLENYDVERLEGDVNPTNLPHVHALTNMGFLVSGINLSEKYGAQLHFTKYLSKKHQEQFQEHFCQVVTPLRGENK